MTCREFEQLMEEGREEGRKEGREEGRKENQLTTARKMLAAGKLPLEEIAEYSNLPLEEVQVLAEEMGRAAPAKI